VVTATRAAALLATFAAAGCSGKMFRPVVPHVVEEADRAVKIDGMYVVHFPGETIDDAQGLRFDLEVFSPAAARVGEVRLSALHLPACASGLKSKIIVSAPGSDVRTQDVEVAFSRPAAEAAGMFADRSATLDLLLFSADRSAPAHCLRIRVVDSAVAADAAQWVHRALLLGGEERVMIFHSAIPGLKNPGLVLGLGLGAWNGRWRWMLEGEGGFSGRADPVTGETGGGRLFTLWGGSLSGSTLLLNRGRFGLGAIGGYEVLRGSANGPVTPGVTIAPMTLHGPRVGVRLLYLVDPLAWPGFKSPRDAFGGGIAIYAGNWWNGGDLRNPSPFFAVSLEGNLGF
jgi:hypothetical protein